MANKVTERKKKALHRALDQYAALNIIQHEILSQHPDLTRDVSPLDVAEESQNATEPFPENIKNKSPEYKADYQKLIKTIFQRSRLWTQMRNTVTSMPFGDIPEVFFQATLSTHGLTHWTSYYEFHIPLARNDTELRIANAGSRFFRVNLQLL